MRMNMLHRLRGKAESHVCMDRIAIEILLNVRGLVIETARARRSSNEPSLEKQRGLGDLVQSNEWFSAIRVECQ